MFRIAPLLCLLASLLPAQKQAVPLEDPLLLPLMEKGEGAPAKSKLKTTVILSDIKRTSRWNRAISALEKGGYRKVVRVTPWNPQRAFKELKRIAPGAVIAVFRPQTIDVNFHFDFLERACALDADPFVDFAFGYVTGGTPEEAEAFAKNLVRLRKRSLARSILEFGPSTRPAAPGSPRPHKWAEGFTTRRWAHPQDADDVAKTLVALAPRGVLSAWGHGMPDGVDHGLKGAELAASKKLDLSACLYFSGPCYCGVPSGWYRTKQRVIEKQEVAPRESFLLGLLRARVGAVFAGLDPDRGETNHHEREHVLFGSSLGEAVKATYDDVVLARRSERLRLPRYEVGKPHPHRDVRETMISGGACRALFGLPDWRPFASAGEDPFQPTLTVKRKSLELSWSGDSKLGRFWMPVDVFNGGGGWTHRLRFRCEVPTKLARSLRKLEVLKLEKDGHPLPHLGPTAAFERHGGKTYLHLTVAFPRNEKDRALIGGRKYEARFRLSAP